MTPMSPEPAHARPKPGRSSATIAAWAVLVSMGGTSVTYNVFHAVQHGDLNLPLALLYGFAPVVAAALLSHIVAEYEGGKFLQGVAFVVMLTAMGLSIGATASVVAPAAGEWMKWAFGGVLDAAALVALRVILDGRNRKAALAAEMEAVRERSREAALERSRLEQERAELETQLATVRAELGAELEAVRAELSTAREAVPQGGPKKPTRTAPKAPRTAPEDDVALEARALELLATDLNMPGAELGRKLGVSAGYGRKLRRKLTAPDRPVDRLGPPLQDRPQERSQDRQNGQS